jgi:hypothetical protein
MGRGLLKMIYEYDILTNYPDDFHAIVTDEDGNYELDIIDNCFYRNGKRIESGVFMNGYIMNNRKDIQNLEIYLKETGIIGHEDQLVEHSPNMDYIKRKIQKASKKVNPFAICHTTVDKEKDPEKYERCVMDMKNKKAFNLRKIKKYQQKLKKKSRGIILYP